KINKEQIVLAVRRIDDLEQDVCRAETLTQPDFIRRPGTVHRTICYGMDRRANRSGQVDAVMEVPAIGVDARAVRRVHLIGCCGLAKWPNKICRHFVLLSSPHPMRFEDSATACSPSSSED